MRYYLTTLGLFFFLLPGRCLSAHIYINQVGYQTTAPKVFFVSQPSDSFWILDVTNSQIVFKDALQLFKSSDPATGLELFSGDFSKLSRTGTYQIEVPGVGKSLSFRIAKDVYNVVFNKALKSYYFQRCDFDLLGETATPYYHTRCHQFDAFFHSSTGKSGYKNTAGGWHDAGDFGKYVVNAGITVSTLLMAFEYFPQLFQSDTIKIPESLNEIPDILDETRYELEWLLKMQDMDGGVYFKITPEVFAPFIMPQSDPSRRFIYQKSSTATADFAAILAQAYRVYHPYDAAFADSCLIAARRAWNFLKVNPDIVPVGGFHNPSGTITGEYADSDDRDERLWAAIQLFLSTNEDQFHNYFLQHFREKGVFQGSMSWKEVSPLAQLAYLFSNNESLLSSVKNELRFGLLNYAQLLHQRIRTNGFYVSLNPGEYYWGSNSVVLNNAVLLIFAFELTGNREYLDDAYYQFYYILGLNAHAKSFVTGIGSVYPQYPHHRSSASDGIKEPIPGFLVGGPNQYLQDNVLKTLFNENTPPALCYVDDQNSYASNEVAINWNAPLVFVAGYFSEEKQITQLRHPPDPVIQKLQLLPNYPNPFNNTTRISFYIAKSAPIKLQILDTLGRVILERGLGFLPLGTYYFNWDARDDRGETVSSGVYYIIISSPTNQVRGKMLLLK